MDFPYLLSSIFIKFIFVLLTCLMSCLIIRPKNLEGRKRIFSPAEERDNIYWASATDIEQYKDI